MPWCPVCKNEYVEGITMCADCKVELVESLEDTQVKPLTFGTEEEMTKLNEFLKYNGVLSGKIVFDEAEQIYEIRVSQEEAKQAKKITAIFIQEEARKEQEASETEEISKEPVTQEFNMRQPATHVYEKKKDKEENFKTSAYTLVGVGMIGAVALILCATGIIPFQLGVATYIVMGALFILFFVMGILSYKSYQKIAKEAVAEDALAEEIKKWCLENLTKETIDEGLFQGDIQEEMKYFKRMERMKKLVADTYMNLEQGFLDALLEEVYTDIFEA